MENWSRKLKKVIWILLIKIKEKNFKGGGKYLFKNRNSDILFISFSGFGTYDRLRTYNYIKTLNPFKVDALYIKDTWGYRGSYYLMDHGNCRPYDSVLNLIYKILSRKKYSRIICIGSSKGGSAAILFGLKIGAYEILSGACQYHIGTYVAKFPEVYRGMLGSIPQAEGIQLLDSVLPEAISEHSQRTPQTKIHLFYSKNEHTYEDEIIDLRRTIINAGYPYNETICDFKEHGDVGKEFSKFLATYTKELILK
ncbi:MAG TPA: hypothetical protein DEW31_00235 [Alistipes obesi]|nr:hypothetical protein [Alistipes communis]